MVRVVLTADLRRHAGGAAAVEVEAATTGQLLRALAERHPGLAPLLADEVAVAVDGAIYQDDWTAPLPPGAEVHLLPKIAGG